MPFAFSNYYTIFMDSYWIILNYVICDQRQKLKQSYVIVKYRLLALYNYIFVLHHIVYIPQDQRIHNYLFQAKK